MRPKLVALLVAAAVTIGWLMASIVSPPVANLQTLRSRAGRQEQARDRANTASEVAFVEQLKLKLRAAPTAPVPRRNPFVFGSATTRTTRSAEEATTTAPPTAADLTPVMRGPSLRLAGIGETETEAGTIRTAVISDGRTVHLVKVGEAVSGYAVVAITDAAVTIADAGGAQWILRLR